MAEQLTFDLPAGVSLTAGDFFVSSANTAAFVMVTNPDGWPERKLVLTGPKGSGKSHLARIFAQEFAASIVAAADLSEEMQHPDTPIVVEDIEGLTPAGETVLFHLHNHLAQAKLPLLMTAQTPPGRWPIALPDLASRMQATTPTHIDDPDDELLKAVMMKLFADRQIAYPPDLPSYLAARIERSFAAAAAVVAALDEAALREKRKVNQRLASQVLNADHPTY
ncbi:MAG: DnaA/Hda family protein [Pseudomonadota bacterium]